MYFRLRKLLGLCIHDWLYYDNHKSKGLFNHIKRHEIYQCSKCKKCKTIYIGSIDG